MKNKVIKLHLEENKIGDSLLRHIEGEKYVLMVELDTSVLQNFKWLTMAVRW